MQSKDIILAGVMGLDLSNANHAVFVAETTRGIEDMDAFIEFCRDKKDGIEYSTKTEKLDTLSTMLKKLQTDASLPHDIAKTFSKQLTGKVLQARTYIKNQMEDGNQRPFSTLGDENGKYFTDKELNALSGLGSSAVIIELSEQHKLEESMTELFLSKYIAKSKYEALTSGQQQTKHLIENAIKG